jgi:hypothetical protein
LDSATQPRDDPEHTDEQPRCCVEVRMIAVIGNVIAGLGVISLFTATLRITRKT